MRTSFTQKENIESGLALVAILLITSLVAGSMFTVKISVGLVFLLLIAPIVFYPFTFIWLNLSTILGKASSFVFLTVIFLLVVTPVGLFRRLLGKDRLRLSQFKKSTSSVFEERNHRFIKDDMRYPF